MENHDGSQLHMQEDHPTYVVATDLNASLFEENDVDQETM